MDNKENLVTNLTDRLSKVLKLLDDFKQIQQVAREQTRRSSQVDNSDEVVIRECDIEKLKNDNHRLRARCEILESGINVNVTRQIDDAVDQAHQIEVLTQKISEFGSRKEKIVETLGKKAIEIRASFSILTGYKVYACRDIVYKVKSVYAKGQEDKLVFKFSPQGQIKLIEDNYSKRFSNYVSTFLRNGADHFPAFLASVTIELFNASQSKTEDETTSEDMELTLLPR